MRRNLEIKLELRDPPLALQIAAALGASDRGTLEQTDEYYLVLSGKLKRRAITHAGETTVQYIRYERPPTPAVRGSDYEILEEIGFLERFGTVPFETVATVVKRRRLFLLDGIRIHLDDVDSLGSYFEIEAPIALDASETETDAVHRSVAELLERFAPATGEPVSLGYLDLLQGADASSPLVPIEPVEAPRGDHDAPTPPEPEP